MDNNERIRFMVTMERKRLDALDARARRLNTTRTALINQLVEDFLQSHRATPSTVATTTDIVGSDAAELLDRLVALTSALSEERERLNVKIDALGRGLVSVSKRLNDEARQAQRVEPRQTMRERVAVSARQYRADNIDEIEERERRASTETTSGQCYREQVDAYVERVESMTVDNVTPTAFDFSRYGQ